MEKLKKVEHVVERILREREESRKSDDVLYLHVCEYFNADAPSMTLANFLSSRKSVGCPNFETVRRTRQKVFEKHPDLKPEKITAIREEMRDTFMNYALNG